MERNVAKLVDEVPVEGGWAVKSNRSHLVDGEAVEARPAVEAALLGRARKKVASGAY